MNTILQQRIDEAAKVYSFNIPSKIYQSCKTQEEMKQWKEEIEQAYIEGCKDSLQNQWISVDEALPPYNIKVLVCFKSAFGTERKIFITTRGPENIIVYEKNKFYIQQSGEVTHWMPVPEFPKGGE